MTNVSQFYLYYSSLYFRIFFKQINTIRERYVLPLIKQNFA